LNHHLPRRGAAALLGGALLGGCAAQLTYREAEQLASEGRGIEAIALYEKAVRLEPGNARYRSTLVRARERHLETQLERAGHLRRQGRLADAEAVYRGVLAVHASDDRVTAGLRALDVQRKSDAAAAEAEKLLARNDTDGARALARDVLLESPQHAAARSLLQRIDDKVVRPIAAGALAAAYQKPITIEFKDVPLKTVFEVIARTSGLNFLFDRDVKGDQKTTLYLKNSTIENAVNLTLLTNQLEQRVIDANTILVYPNTQQKTRDYQPLAVRSFHLANADAKAVAASLKALLKTRDVVVDEKLNLVIVRDGADAIRLAEKLVAVHDVPEPEVMLEVEILEVKRARLLDLGIRWPDQLSLSPIGAAGGGALTLADLRRLDSATTAAAISPITLNARKVAADANILANPRIRSRNREKARILIGERVPNITTTSTSTGFVAESVNYVDVGLKLEVEPSVHLDGEVAIRIALEVSNIISQLQTKSGSVAYQIGTRTAQTVLRLRDGENQVLAGLINDEDRRSGNRVPALGDIPVVGRLFGGHTDDATRTEIVLSITPRIIRNIQRPDAAVLEFESGTESNLGARAIPGARR
jgi:general secretion pathway protein D